MWQSEAEISCEVALEAKGEEIQKLSLVESLPRLLAEDAHSCVTQALPKVQQFLPTASAEVHMVASVIFRQVLEQRLVSQSTFTSLFLNTILSSLKNREPVISHAWLEATLDIIELLSPDVIKREILPVAIELGQQGQPLGARISCCRLLGKIATRFDSNTIKKEVIPTVETLCQDVSNDIRACICLQLQYIVEGLKDDDVIALLPFFIEIASDEESSIKQAAVQTIGYLLPKLPSETIKDVLIPLIKIACENAVKTEDNVICVIAQEFGRICQCLEEHLSPQEKIWFIKYFQQLSQIGTANYVQESKQDYTNITNFMQLKSLQINERSVECRRNCAFNIPAVFLFASTVPDGINILLPTYRALASDSFFMVRRTIACSLHEVVKIMGSKSRLIKSELLRLWKDDRDEVLQGIVPNTSKILELLLLNKIIGIDQAETFIPDLGKALIKCEAEIALTTNWRLSATMFNQLQVLPKCFSSDYINTYFVPVAMSRVLHARPLPVRLSAGKALLIFLRYNLKSHQKSDIRHQICVELGRNSSSYIRMIFILMMIEAMSIFSSAYFKEHFCHTLLSMLEDSIANIRLKVVELLPEIKSMFKLPSDKKLVSHFDTCLRNLVNSERDKDVNSALGNVMKHLENMQIKADSQVHSPTKLSEQETEDIAKYEEEKKLDAMTSVKLGSSIDSPAKNLPSAQKIGGESNRKAPIPDSYSKSVRNRNSTNSRHQTNIDSSSKLASKPPSSKLPSTPSRSSSDYSKASSSSDELTRNWSRIVPGKPQPVKSWSSRSSLPSRSYSSSASSNITHSSSCDYLSNKIQCRCYNLTDRSRKPQILPSKPSYRSDTSYCSCLSSTNFLRTTNLFNTDSSKVSSLNPLRDSNADFWRSFTLSRDNLSSRYRMPEFSTFPHYNNSCWTFGSMPEISALVDEEFMIDAGIKLPSQVLSSQNYNKIPNLQDMIHRSKKFSAIDRITDDLSKPSSSGYSSSSSSSRDISQYSSQPISQDHSKSVSASQNRPRLTFDVSQKKLCNSPFSPDKERLKHMQPRQIVDRNKRSPTSYNPKLVEAKDSKFKTFKRHNSVDVPEYNPAGKNVRNNSIRKFSNLDVNHNQGMSKIPVRNVHVSGSRTAPSTRTSSPIRVKPDLPLIEQNTYRTSDTYSRERSLRRFLSSDEEVEKLYKKF